MFINRTNPPKARESASVGWDEMLLEEGVYRLVDVDGPLKDVRFIVLNDDAGNAIYVTKTEVIECYKNAWIGRTFCRTDEKVYFNIH